MTDRLEMARKALEQAERDTENWAGPCHQCKYRKAWMIGSDRLEWDYCTNELARLKTFTPSTGFDGKPPECRVVRSPGGLCGPEGQLFEPKLSTQIQKKGFWATILGR
jgi:hypothetical protein